MRRSILGIATTSAIVMSLSALRADAARQATPKATVQVNWHRIAESPESSIDDAKIGIWRLTMSIPNSDVVLESRWIGDRNGRPVRGPTTDVDPEFHTYGKGAVVPWHPRLALDQDLAALVPLDFGSEEVDFGGDDAKLARQSADVRSQLERLETDLEKRFKVIVNPAALVLRRVDSK